MKIIDDVAYFESKLLCAAIWGGEVCLPNVKYLGGYINPSIDGLGKAFIEYCVARACEIYRLPKCGYDNYLYYYNNMEYSHLSEKEVEIACQEMKEVINHVRTKLPELKGVRDGKIRVVRNLSKYQYPTVAEQLNDENNKIISFPVSIISSYAYDQNSNENVYGRDENGRHINIIENIPIEDIILYDKFVGNGRQQCMFQSMQDEECELWVVDRSITGIKRLPRECFNYSDGIPNRNGAQRIYTKEFGTDTPVYNDKKTLPCDYNWLTRAIIKHNIKKISQKSQQKFPTE